MFIYLDLLRCPLVQVDGFHSGDVDTQVAVDASTADTHEHPEVPWCPSRTCRECKRETSALKVYCWKCGVKILLYYQFVLQLQRRVTHPNHLRKFTMGVKVLKPRLKQRHNTVDIAVSALVQFGKQGHPPPPLTRCHQHPISCTLDSGSLVAANLI